MVRRLLGMELFSRAGAGEHESGGTISGASIGVYSGGGSGSATNAGTISGGAASPASAGSDEHTETANWFHAHRRGDR